MSNPLKWNRRENTESSQNTTGKQSSRSSNHFVAGGMLTSSIVSFRSLANAFFATALCRAWNLIVLSTLWAACVTLISAKVHDLSIQPTLLTVYGIVVGFTISYRTSSSFERYNEGRKLWSTIVLATRTFSRTVWFHVPNDPLPECKEEEVPQARARIQVEKRAVINLVEAFSVAVKHYLRGEDGIEYEDLYHLVKFLPVYALPSAIPRRSEESERSSEKVESPTAQTYGAGIPLPVTSKGNHKKTGINNRPGASTYRSDTVYRQTEGLHGTIHLAPASNPPQWSVYDIWPLSLLVKHLLDKGISISGKTAARQRPRELISHNVPLEISFYLSSYISALQQKKGTIDVPTTNLLFASLNQLVESLSGLERVLTNPIPFSYGVHLWTACSLYIILMPFQIWKSFGYITIPATTFAAFFFFGFLAAGEEIENPFGYDKNDLDLDSFCRDIIRTELAVLTSRPPSSPDEWAFIDGKDRVFPSKPTSEGTLDKRVGQGIDKMQEAMKHDTCDE